MTNRSVKVVYDAVITPIQAKYATLRRDTIAVGAEMTKAARANKQEFTQLGVGIGAAGAAIALGLGKAVSAAADFDKEMSAVAAVSGAGAAEMLRLRDAALEAGKATKFSATQSAQAQAELAKAGIATADILGGALSGALSLAAAGNLDLANAATVAAQAMNVFKLEGSDVGHVADVLAAGANKSAADVGQLGDALRQGGLVAAQTGLTLEETVGALSAFADSALVGSDAGTSLKTMLQRLTPQSEEASQLMSELGFSAYDAQGNFIGLAGLAGELQSSLKDMTVEQRNAAMATLFGSDAVRGAAVLYEQGAAGVQEFVAAVNDQGAAARTSAQLMDNLRGDIEEFSGSVETALIEFGENAQAPLRSLTQTATGMVNALADLPEGAQTAAVGFGGLASAAGLIGGGFLVAAPRIVQTKDALDALSKTMPKTVGGLRSMGSFLTGPWGVALGVAAAGLIYYANQKQDAANATEALIASLERESGAFTVESRNLVAARLVREGAVELAHELGMTTADLVDAVLNEGDARARVTAALERQIAAQEGLDTTDQQEAAGKLSEVLAHQINIADDSIEVWTAQSEATERASGANWRAAESASAAAEGLEIVGTAAGRVTPELEDLTDAQEAWQSSISAFIAPANAYTQALQDNEVEYRAWAEAQAEATSDASDTWKEYFDENSQRLQVSTGEWLAELEKQAQAQQDFAQNVLTLTSRLSHESIQMLVEMGPAGADAAANLVNATDEELARFDTIAATRARTGADAFARELDAAGPTLTAIAGKLGQGTADSLAAKLAAGTITIDQIMQRYGAAIVRGVNPILVQLGRAGIRVAGVTGVGGNTEMATGGTVPGSGVGDIVPAMLEPEEFVVRRAVARQVRPALEALNDGDLSVIAQRYAAGGSVGFRTASDVPAAPSFAPYRDPLRAPARAGAEEIHGDTVEFVKKYAVPPLGPGIGYAAMMAALRIPFPGLALISGLRPGAITATGKASWHGKGRAVDIPPRMDVFNWIAQHYGSQALELIFSPAGGRQLYRGRPHIFGEPTRGDHWDHIHWAMRNGGLVKAKPGGTRAILGDGGRDEIVMPVQHLQAGGPVTGLGALMGGLNPAAGASLGGPNSAATATIMGAGLGLGSLQGIHDAIAAIEALVDEWDAAADAAEEAAERAELVADAAAALAEQHRVAAEYNRVMADGKSTLEDRVDAHMALAEAQEEAAASAQAIIDFDQAVTLAAEERAIAEQLAALAVAERIAVNQQSYEFDRMTAEQQLAWLDARIAAEQQYTDEWMSLTADRERVADQIAQDEQRRIDEQEAREEAADERRRRRNRRIVAEARAAREERERIAANRTEWEFDRMTTEAQLADVERRMRSEREFSDEWMTLARQRDQLSAELADAQLAREAEVRDAATATARVAADAAAEATRAAEEAARAAAQAADEQRRVAEEALGRLNQLLDQAADLRRQQADRVVAHEQQVADAVRARGEALANYARADQRATIAWGSSIGAVTRNLGEQVRQMGEWAGKLSDLRSRGLSEDAIAALGLGAGPQALGQVRMFTRATEEQIAALNAAVAARQAAGAAQADVEKAGMLGDLGAQLAGFQESLDADMASLGAQLQALGMDHGRSYAEAVAEAMTSELPGIAAALAAAMAAGDPAAVRAVMHAAAAAAAGASGSSTGTPLGGVSQSFDEIPQWVVDAARSWTPEQIAAGGDMPFRFGDFALTPQQMGAISSGAPLPAGDWRYYGDMGQAGGGDAFSIDQAIAARGDYGSHGSYGYRGTGTQPIRRDTGGPVPPGLSMVWNGLGEQEYILRSARPAGGARGEVVVPIVVEVDGKRVYDAVHTRMVGDDRRILVQSGRTVTG